MAQERPDRLLILDLDETLIYGAESALQRPADFYVGPFHVYRRPHLAAFLETVAQWYELAIWSSASSDYVSSIARQICPTGHEWRFVWARDRCTRRMHAELLETFYLKDLKKVKRLGYDMRRILAVDDSPLKTSRNFGNAIYVRGFEGAAEDDELLALQSYLRLVREVDDYRKLEKRGWRSRATANLTEEFGTEANEGNAGST